jgi:hypothetical protein
LRLRSGFALPSAQAQRKSLTLIVAESHLDCRAAPDHAVGTITLVLAAEY